MAREGHDWLLRGIDQLEKALDVPISTRRREWTQRVYFSLGSVAESLRSHRAKARAMDGQIASAEELAQEICPTLDRRVDALVQEEADLLDSITSVRMALEIALHSLSSENGADRETGWHFERLRAIPNLAVLRESGKALVDSLRQHIEAETMLFLETVNTEIGVGD